MGQEGGERRGQILVLRQDLDDCSSIAELLRVDVPNTNCQGVCTVTELRSEVYRCDCDIVVLDCDWSLAGYQEMIYELKNTDSQPSLIILTNSADPQTITELYKHGCHRCIVKDERWQTELPLAVRHLLRFRQVLDENLRVRTKLTEANMLLDERNKRLDEFGATVAHDIKAPLGGISMKLEYLLDHHNGHLDQRSRELLTRALASCHRLTTIVQAMYDFARLGAKATKMNHIKLTELVNEVVGDLSLDPALNVQIGIADLPEIWGSEALIRRLFANLIGNAIKYNSKESIMVNILSRGIIERNLGSFCEICVEDNGPGIPEEERTEIFSMFRRGTTAKGAAEGSGVGLAVVSRIAELHFGEVRLDSKVGAGSRFIVLLPVDDVALVR